MSLPPQSKSLRSTRDEQPSANLAGGGKYAGKRLGKFQIVGELGRGGMGVVLEARDTVLDRNVAIKLLPRSVANRPDSLERFLREARAAAKLHHPNVVAVYEADQLNGQYYIVLELVRGGSMQDLLRNGPLPWDEATRVVLDACKGLATAHQAGLVHRDIKPANLMRSTDGTVKIADFGLARAMESTGVSMTGSGQVLGTPQFMSPEQCRSELADARSDVYSMGATYFTLMTGQVPFPGEAPLLVMNAHLWNPIPDPSELVSSIPPACVAIIRKAMAKDPDDRYPNAEALLVDLEQCVAGVNSETINERSAPAIGSVVNEASPKTRHGVSDPKTLRTEQAVELSWGLTKAVSTDSQSAQRPARRTVNRRVLLIGAGVISIGAMVMLLGWSLLSGRTSTPSTVPPSKETSTAKAAGIRSSSPTLLPLADNAFHLPGMRRDAAKPGVTQESWSMHYAGISHVAMANSGEFLVVLTNMASQPGRVHVWSRDGKRLLEETLQGRATSVAIAFDSSRIAVGTTGGDGVLLWNTRTWERDTAAVPDEGGDIDAVAFHDGGRWLGFTVAPIAMANAKAAKTTSATSDDGTWVLWDLAANRQTRSQSFRGSGRMRAIVFTPEEQLTLLTGSDDGRVRSWVALANATAKESRTVSIGVAITALACSPQPNMMAVGAGKYFSLWNYQTAKREHAVATQAGDIASVVFSPSGNEVCWANAALIQCLEIASRRSTATFAGSNASVLSLTFLPDESRIFTAGADGKLVLWWVKR